MRPRMRYSTLLAASLTVACLSAPLDSAQAFTYVTDDSGTAWGIQDSAPPGTDTGSIRATQEGTGVQAPYSTMINGYGGIRVSVETAAKNRFDGALMRGFGLEEVTTGHFESTASVDLSGADITRTIDVRDAGYGRWLDTFTNTTGKPLTIDVAFGGQLGYGASGTNASSTVASSSGDATIDTTDVWTASQSGAGTTTWQGPTSTVTGSFDRTGNWLRDTFTQPYSAEGHAANFPAYVNTLVLAPGSSASLLHFVAVGTRVTADTADAQLTAVTDEAARLAEDPDLDGLSDAEIASVANFDGLSTGSPVTVPQPAAAVEPPTVTSVRYDVVDKTVRQLQADMESGKTTSVEITQAYLDRIAAYSEGPFGLNAFTTVAPDALARAKQADKQRAKGRTGALLGIPIAMKDLYDTADMPTTNGSLTFEGFYPAEDAYQVAQLRKAGAVIIGKASMEEYATSGSYSDNAYGTVWNAFDPSRSALASSGGSAVATATSMAAATFGSQTGDSLYAPASAASLVTLRGTDGMQSDRGVMPLSWLQDYAGTITRTVPDLADILNVVSGTDPENPETAEADAHRPEDWRSVLKADALEGARIGILPSAWVDPYGTSTVIDASKAALTNLEDAGAEIVEVASGPVAPSRPSVNVNWEGWARYLESHPELDMDSPADVICSQVKLPYTRYTPAYCDGMQRLTDEQVAAWRGYRADYKKNIGDWMDANDLDAVVYPGLLSEISLNDGGGNRSSFGRRDTPSGSSGVPTVAFPAGTDANGAPINLQLMGRAWDDAKIVGYAYAFEEVADGHVAPTTAPKLSFVKGTTTTKAKVKHHKIKRGRGHTMVTVKVKTTREVAVAGKVRVRVAGKTRTVKVEDGKATVRIGKFAKPGRKVVHVRYQGSRDLTGSKAKAFLRVVR
ncbi:hypothetical protein BH09ACT12_BH09ACT12_24290 [soil metagenome]